MLNYRNSSTALLVIDVQNDYCSPEGRVAQSGRPMQSVYRAVRNTEKLLGRARRAGIPIAFTRMVYDPKKISAGNLRRLEKIGLDGLCAPRSNGAGFYRVKPLAVERVFAKNFYDAFYRTRLDAWLKKNKVKTVILCGVATNICVMLTAAGAYYRGYEVVVANDCVGEYEDREFALRSMRKQFAARDAPGCKWVQAALPPSIPNK